jgi:hypothetical protein
VGIEMRLQKGYALRSKFLPLEFEDFFTIRSLEIAASQEKQKS